MSEYGEPLTEREKEILQMVATGVTNREVALRLSISVNTVKVHLRNVYSKLGAESRTEATVIAMREGWVVVDGGREPTISEEGAPVQPQLLPVAPKPPLPWFKRVTLIAVALLVVAGVAVTWPRDSSQAGNGADLPFDRSSTQSPAALVGGTESPWHERAQMPTRRAHLALVVAQGQVLAIGGRTPEGITAAVETYDPASDTWAPGSDKPTPAAYVAAAAVGTDVIVPGGCDAEGTATQTVEVYNVVSDSWREVSPLPEARCAYALSTFGGKLYIFGGWDGEQYVRSAYVYDPQADTWIETIPLDTERGFAAAASLNGLIYVVGGYDGDRELSTCTAYDPTTETSTVCTPLTVGRGGLGMIALAGQLYAIGGGGWTSYLGFNERYNPKDNAWSPIDTPLVGEWRSPGVVLANTTIFAIGGQSSDYLSLNQVYEPLPFRTFIPLSP
jgi:DNA-binding CsgD family transcriptional regulator/N-acetylneuraminic acid mutarotase